MSDELQVPCKICGASTRMLGTELCDPCWELLHRITFNQKRFKQVLNYINEKEVEILP